MTESSASKTAFVLAGGGRLGAVEVGMLETLVGQGISADLVVGSSVGAINAAYFASRPDAEGVRSLGRIWRGLRRRDVFPFAPFGSLLSFFSLRNYLVDPTPSGTCSSATCPTATWLALRFPSTLLRPTF